MIEQETQSTGGAEVARHAEAEDPVLIRDTGPAVASEKPEKTEVLRSSQAIRAERQATMQERFGGFYWGADFLGFAVALFFLLVFLGIVGAIVGTVGFQLHASVPKVGGSLTQAQQSLGLGALIGSLVALFLAFFIGGYAAGRMARFDGMKNGIGVVFWTVVVAVVLGIAGAIAGTQFNVASQLHLNLDTGTLTGTGVISVAAALVTALVAAGFGGLIGERYHRTIDRASEVLR
jgi:hypothetical protein